MHVVRLPYPDRYTLALQLAVDEHQLRMREQHQETGTTILGRVAMLPVVGPGQKLISGVGYSMAGTDRTEQDHPLYLALLQRDVGRLATVQLAYHFGVEVVGEHHQGVVLLYDRPEDMDAIHDRAHWLVGQVLETTAAERRSLTTAGVDPGVTYASLALPYDSAA